MRIEEEYIRTGYFWLPEKSKNKIPGILSIRDGGEIELEVIGLFDESIQAINSDYEINRIIGHFEKDGLVTLDKCFYKKKSISFGGISKSKIHVNRVLRGAAYDKDEEVTFNTLSFSVDCLDEWINIRGINVDIDSENKTATISNILPKSPSYVLENGMQLEINFEYTLPSFPTITEAKITQRVYFKLKSEHLRPLTEFTNIAYKITNFLCFAIDDTVSLKRLIATSSEIQEDGLNSKTYPVLIYIYYPSIPFKEKIPERSWQQMLFTFKVIEKNAEKVFNNWIKAYETISPALDLYFSTKFGAHKYLDGKFLALAQGLETYHRRTSNEKLMDDKKYNSLVDTIKKNCPKENIEWLEERLEYGNEINLSKRIKRIIEPFKDYIGNSKGRNKLIRKIVDTRNYLTHYNIDLEQKSAQKLELLILCQRMQAIFQLHFLKVIGFTDNEVKNIIENSYSLKRKLTTI